MPIPTTKWFGTPNHFESSIYSREKVWQSPNLFGSGIEEGFILLYQNEPLAFQVKYNGDYDFVLDFMRWKTLGVPAFLRKQNR